jgi:hypothetical protein
VRWLRRTWRPRRGRSRPCAGYCPSGFGARASTRRLAAPAALHMPRHSARDGGGGVGHTTYAWRAAGAAEKPSTRSQALTAARSRRLAPSQRELPRSASQRCAWCRDWHLCGSIVRSQRGLRRQGEAYCAVRPAPALFPPAPDACAIACAAAISTSWSSATSTPASPPPPDT